MAEKHSWGPLVHFSSLVNLTFVVVPHPADDDLVGAVMSQRVDWRGLKFATTPVSILTRGFSNCLPFTKGLCI